MSSDPILDVVCLCAEWCGTCREYRATFDALKQAMPGHRYRWIDIEDEADAISDVDVETFPTLLVAHQGQVMFAGPVLPRLGDAQRLVEVQMVLVREGRVAEAAAAAAQGMPGDQVEAYQVLARQLSRG